MKQIKNLTSLLYAMVFGSFIAAATGSLGMGFVFAVLKYQVSKRMKMPVGAFGEGNPEGGKTPDEIKAEIKKKQEELRTALDSKAEKSEVEKLKLDLSILADEKKSAEIKALEDTIEEVKAANVKQGEEITALKATGVSGKEKSLSDELKEKKDGLKKLAKGENGEIEVKALVLRSAVTDNQSAFDLPDIGQLATRKLVLYDVFPKLRVGKGTHSGTIRYYDWDEATIARAAAMVTEGAAFPESTAKFKMYTIDLKKIGDTLPVTEEFFEDEALFAAELGMFLETNVKLKIDDQLANGDGTGNNIKGLMASISAYTPVASAIQDASIYDLIVKMKEDITKNRGSKFSPDVVLMNITDINKMKLKKDNNDNYILPPFVSRDGQVVDGMIVIEANGITENQIALGDRRFARIYEMAGAVVEKGYVGTQFTEDEMTLKVRKRLLFLVRNCDAVGFRKVTDITAALTTLAS